MVNEVRYSAFGEMRYLNGETVTDLLYTGQKLQEELGLYYYVARWYDPYLNRFLSPDTIIPDQGRSAAYDRYAYVYNNPLRYVDPSGIGLIGLIQIYQIGFIMVWGRSHNIPMI